MKSKIKKQIFLDPGHVGGEIFDLRDFIVGGYRVREGDFSFVWAEALKRELESIGWVVGMTRARGQPAIAYSEERARKRCDELLASSTIGTLLEKYHVPRKLFPNYTEEQLLLTALKNEQDLLHRAKLVNLSTADMCISLHLNGDPLNRTTDANGICGFANSASALFLSFFGDLICRIAKGTNVPILKNQFANEMYPGLYIRDDFILLNNTKRPTLIVEGPFQNNISVAKEISISLDESNDSSSHQRICEDLTQSIKGAFVEWFD
jgi:N-acetylmuramoyl-L-alanine amidase